MVRIFVRKVDTHRGPEYEILHHRFSSSFFDICISVVWNMIVGLESDLGIGSRGEVEGELNEVTLECISVLET